MAQLHGSCPTLHFVNAMSSGMDSFRNRCYESYVSTHAGRGSTAATALIYRRDIRPYLPAGRRETRVLDIGCGQGELVRLLHNEGFDARGIDISPEQVSIGRTEGL